MVVKLASWWINVHGGWQFCLINVVLACNVWFNIILTQFIATRLETAHLGRITIIGRKIAWFKMKDIKALVANERSQEAIRALEVVIKFDILKSGEIGVIGGLR